MELLGTWVGVTELAAEMVKDRTYYEKSGGGVTVSGGEPTMQANFVAALMARLQAWAISVGIEQVWVCTEREGRAAAFYQQCGYARVENLTTRRGEDAGIFTKRLPLPR